MPLLPPELILHITQCLIPSNPPVAFPASHPITRTLLSLSLACKLTSDPAVLLLHQHCLYIESDERSQRLTATSTHALATIIKDGTSMIDPRTLMCLYLAPFSNGSLNQPLVAQRAHRLFSKYCLALRRLVVDMPLRSLYPEDDHYKVRPVLRAAFSMLGAIEEFCSVRDELFLNALVGTRRESEVWHAWRRLKRLALYNADVASPEFLYSLRQCRSLTHLVLTRVDGLEERIDASEFVSFPHLQRVMIVNTEQHCTWPLEPLDAWESCFLGRIWATSPHLSRGISITAPDAALRGSMDQLLVRIKVPRPAGRGDEDREGEDIELCQEWVREHAIDGTLWEFPGIPVY